MSHFRVGNATRCIIGRKIFRLTTYTYICRVYKKGAFSNVNKKFISQITRAQLSKCLMRVSQPFNKFTFVHTTHIHTDTNSSLSRCGMSAVNGLQCMRYPITKFPEGHGPWCYINAVFNEPPQRKNRMVLDMVNGVARGEGGFLLLKHLGNWLCGPTVSMTSELLVALEKLRQLPLLTVYVVPV